MKILLMVPLLMFGMAFSSCSSEKRDPAPLEVFEIKEFDQILNFPADASRRSIAVETNHENILISVDQSWCHATHDVVNKKSFIDVRVDASTVMSPRTAIVTLKAGTVSKIISVTQLGVSPAIVVSEKSKVVNFKSQTVQITVASNIEIEAIADVPWLTQQKNKAANFVDYQFVFNVESLPRDVADRSARITFIQKDGELKESMTLKQALVLSDTYSPGSTSSFNNSNYITPVLRFADTGVSLFLAMRLVIWCIRVIVFCLSLFCFV